MEDNNVSLGQFVSPETNKKKLIIRLPALAEQTTNIPGILVQLLSRAVLHWRERDTIMAHASDYDRTIEICKHILQKGDTGFEHFLSALHESGNGLIAGMLAEPLSPVEDSRSFEECLVAHDSARSPIISAVVREIESFNATLTTTNVFNFILIGVPGLLSMSAILTEYTVLNNSGEVLFYLMWRPANTGVQLANVRLVNFCELCWPTTKLGVTRACQNLIGNVVMEVNTELGYMDIRVGGNYWGRIRRSWFVESVHNRRDEEVCRIKESVWGWLNGTQCKMTQQNGAILATFQKVEDGQDDEEVGQALPVGGTRAGISKRMKLTFAEAETTGTSLSANDRALVIAAAIMKMDQFVYRRAWTPCKVFFIYLAVLISVVLIPTLIAVLA